MSVATSSPLLLVARSTATESSAVQLNDSGPGHSAPWVETTTPGYWLICISVGFCVSLGKEKMIFNQRQIVVDRFKKNRSEEGSNAQRIFRPPGLLNGSCCRQTVIPTGARAITASLMWIPRMPTMLTKQARAEVRGRSPTTSPPPQTRARCRSAPAVGAQITASAQLLAVHRFLSNGQAKTCRSQSRSVPTAVRRS